MSSWQGALARHRRKQQFIERWEHELGELVAWAIWNENYSW